MTESEWLAATDPMPLLAFCQGQPTRRKGILYTCAGLRQIWSALYDDVSRTAVDVAERHAEGLASSDEIKLASYEAEAPTFGYGFDATRLREWGRTSQNDVAIRRLIKLGAFTESDLAGDGAMVDDETIGRLINASHIAYHALYMSDGLPRGHILEHISIQADWPGAWLTREIVGNPFRPVAVDPAWLAWNGGVVGRLAERAYQERELPSGHLDAGRLALVADALEDAGCTVTGILGHLRSAGHHVRGCWAVDLLTARN